MFGSRRLSTGPGQAAHRWGRWGWGRGGGRKLSCTPSGDAKRLSCKDPAAADVRARSAPRSLNGMGRAERHLPERGRRAPFPRARARARIQTRARARARAQTRPRSMATCQARRQLDPARSGSRTWKWLLTHYARPARTPAQTLLLARKYRPQWPAAGSQAGRPIASPIARPPEAVPVAAGATSVSNQ